MFFKIKNVESLLSMQANSDISVLHLTNDRLNCSGLLAFMNFNRETSALLNLLTASN